jgi:hypothetical protein
MRKIFTILMTLAFSSMFSQFTQPIKYPRFEIDSLGQKVITMTIPQAMKLNNNSNLLEKFEKLDTEIRDYENIYIKVINEKNEVITKLKVVVDKQDQQLIIKDDKIKTLQEEIFVWIQKDIFYKEQLSNRQETIDEKNKQISRMKNKMVVGGIGGGVIIIGLTLSVLGFL